MATATAVVGTSWRWAVFGCQLFDLVVVVPATSFAATALSSSSERYPPPSCRNNPGVVSRVQSTGCVVDDRVEGVLFFYGAR